MDAFKIVRNGKVLDYRIGAKLDLNSVKEEFSKKYKVLDLRQANRHVIGTLEKDNKRYILKLSTTEGIGARTETEKIWNDEFNKLSTDPSFRVPQNIEDGYFQSLYFLITEKFDGLLVGNLNGKDNSIEENLDRIINFSEYIQALQVNIPTNDAIQTSDYKRWFIEKTKTWLDSTPPDITEKFNTNQLFEIVKSGASKLEQKPRHGDFTPWHLIVMKDALGLIDGEHALTNGVENYDICYFIQRVHSILEMPELATKIYDELIKREHSKEKLQTVLASRAIGGFLDESLKEKPSYESEEVFMKWVVEL